MMLPVVRVLIERAESARFRLVGLAEVLPEAMLDQSQPGDLWSARFHLAHALTSDTLSLELIDGGSPAQFGGWFVELEPRRLAAIEAGAMQPVRELLDTAAAERRRMVRALATLGPSDLEETAALPARSAWGEPARITLYQYLEAWSAHDPGHEQAIRLAILARPDLSAVALARRRR